MARRNKKENKIGQFSLTLLRLVLASIFIYHGYLKLFVVGNLIGLADFLALIGIPFANYAAVLVAVLEFAGGIFLLLGVLTRWTSLALIINMLVALFKVHLPNGFNVGNGGYEFVLLIAVTLLVILINGPGRFSIGKSLFKSRHWE
jgi:putative oxidoreductase